MDIRNTPRRLNCGCGTCGAPDWISADRISAPRVVDLGCDSGEDLLLEDGCIDYASGLLVGTDLRHAVRYAYRKIGTAYEDSPILDHRVRECLCVEATR